MVSLSAGFFSLSVAGVLIGAEAIPPTPASSCSSIDVKARSVLERVPVGPFSEEIALHDSGEVGIFSYSALGNVRTFAPSDFAGTLSRDVELPGDAAGVAFFPGTKIAYVVRAPNPLTLRPWAVTRSWTRATR
jgi:hypothetical protein